MVSIQDLSVEHLTRELKLAEEALVKNQILQQQQQIDSGGEQSNTFGDGDENDPEIIHERLLQMEQTANSLQFLKDVVEWMKSVHEDADILEQAQHTEELGKLVLSIFENNHESYNNEQQLQDLVLHEMYLPLHAYVTSMLVQDLRDGIQKSGYPTPQACAFLLQACKDEHPSTTVPAICAWLSRLHSLHESIITILEGTAAAATAATAATTPAKSLVLIEFMRPIVERVQYHFVQESEDRITTTRIDRLPEWVVTYIREQVFQTTDDHPVCAFDLIQQGLSMANIDLPIQFINDIILLFHHVLLKRNFFRHDKIVGPRSNPLLLCQAMEQLLEFDTYLRQLTHSNKITSTNNVEHDYIGVVDTVVVQCDDELLTWWMEQERYFVLITLFNKDTSDKNNKNNEKSMVVPMNKYVSSRSELFTALLRSVQAKAAVLSRPSRFLNHVAVPLCMEFLDDIHATSTDLKQLLCSKNADPTHNLESNLLEWIELINGTHLATKVLLREGAWQDGTATTATTSDHDLARFGRSLQKLQHVLIEEFSATFVETILMERAKLASYIMMSSHLLASEEWESETDYEYDNDNNNNNQEVTTLAATTTKAPTGVGMNDDLSTELLQTHAVLKIFHKIAHAACESVQQLDRQQSNDNHYNMELPMILSVVDFAPRAIQAQVMNRVADKFLEVALDIHCMAPDIWFKGATIFAKDVQRILNTGASIRSNQTNPNTNSNDNNNNNNNIQDRLLEIVQLMAMEPKKLISIRDALCGLLYSSSTTPIYFMDINDFSNDETIYNEAMSMIRAKGYVAIELSDVASIINRRRDL